MAIDNPTATPESEPETFVELSYRFMSAKHRLRVALNDFADYSKEQKSAYFVMDEAINDLEKLYKDLDAWGESHEHTPKAPKEVQS